MIKVIPFVNGVPGDYQSRITWIKNGELLEGASTQLGSDGILNTAAAQIQENVVTLDQNINFLYNESVDHGQKIENIQAIIDQSGSLDIIETVQRHTTEIDGLTVKTNNLDLTSTQNSNDIDVIKGQLGQHDILNIRTVFADLNWIKNRIGQEVNQDINGQEVLGNPATGIKVSINNIIQQSNLQNQKIVNLENIIDSADPNLTKENVTQIRSELGTAPALVTNTIYVRLDALETDATNVNTSISEIKEKIGFDRSLTIIDDLDLTKVMVQEHDDTLYATQTGLVPRVSTIDTKLDVIIPKLDTVESDVNGIKTELSGAGGVTSQIQDIKTYIGIVPQGETPGPTTLEGRFTVLQSIQNDTQSTVQDMQQEILDLRNQLIALTARVTALETQ